MGKHVTIDGYRGPRLITNTAEEKAVCDGRAYMVGIRIDSLSDDGTFEVFISNPDSGNLEVIHLTALRASTGGDAFLDLYTDSSVDSSGTSADVVNRQVGSSNTSLATVEYDGTYTTGDAGPSAFLPGGTVGFLSPTPGAESLVDAFDLDPGHSIHFIVTNKSGGTEPVSVSMRWYEER